MSLQSNGDTAAERQSLKELARKTAGEVWDAGMHTMPSVEQLILSALQAAIKEKDEALTKIGENLGWVDPNVNPEMSQQLIVESIEIIERVLATEGCPPNRRTEEEVMAEIDYEFQLPLEFGTEDAASGLSWWVKDQEGSVIVENDTRMRCEAICEAVNSHDTLQSAVDELLGAVEPLANYKTNLEPDSYNYVGDISGNNITAGHLRNAHQTFTKHKHLRSPQEDK